MINRLFSTIGKTKAYDWIFYFELNSLTSTAEKKYEWISDDYSGRFDSIHKLSFRDNKQLWNGFIEEGLSVFDTWSIDNLIEKTLLMDDIINSVCVKSIYNDNRIIGFFGLAQCSYCRIRSSDDELVLDSFSIIILQKSQMKMLVEIDSLTGTFNREYFENIILTKTESSSVEQAVILSDVNGLKMINDVFGFHEGDQLLARIAEILRDSSPANARIARWGGDEFIIIIPDYNENMAQLVCNEIKTRCSEHYSEIPISLSLGLSTARTDSQTMLEAIHHAEEQMYRHKLLEGKSVRSSIIISIRATLFEKSKETEEHAQRISVLCGEIADVMNLSSELKDELNLFATLHDVGKISISDKILLKPGPLDAFEWTEMEKHSESGYRIINRVPGLSKVAEYVLCHHERWDGKGYPRGLKELDIPLPSRILAVADSFDAMVNDRPYRRALSLNIAIDEIRKNSGTQYDPRVVDIFIKSIN